MIPAEIIEQAKKHIEKSSQNKDTDYFCITRDIFQARLDSFIFKSQKYIVLADFGRGIKESLSSVIKLSSDVEAVETGFTKQISDRRFPYDFKY